MFLSLGRESNDIFLDKHRFHTFFQGGMTHVIMQMVRAIESTIKKIFALHYSVIGSKTSAGKASNKYQGEQVNWNLNMYFIAQNDQINKLLHQNGLRGGDQQCSVKYQRIACSFSISNQERWPHTNMHTDLMNQLIQVRDQRWGAYPSCHGTRGQINPGHVATQSGLARRDRQAFTLMFTPTASFHPSIFLSNSGSQGGWSLSQLSLGNKAGYTVDMSPVHHRAKIDRQTTTPIATLKPPVTLLCSLWTSGNQCKLHTKRFPVNSNF